MTALALRLHVVITATPVAAKNVLGGKSLKTNVVVTNAITAMQDVLAKDATGTNSGKTENVSILQNANVTLAAIRETIVTNAAMIPEVYK